MEIFNIHLFEFVLIAGLALVIFGPERLPEVGRFLGKQVARFLAWQQQSPELQMINEIRSEFEQEIGTLRDELVRTRQQLDVQKEAQALQQEVTSALDMKKTLPPANGSAQAEPSIAPPRPADPAPPLDSLAEPLPTPTETAQSIAPDIATPAADVPPSLDTVAQAVPSDLRPNKLAHSRPATVLNPADDLPPLPRHRQNLHDSSHSDAPLPAPPSSDELSRQISALSAELAALRAALTARGLLPEPSANADSVNSMAEEAVSS